MPVTTVPDRLTDATLIAAVRCGDVKAYGLLYERHLSAANRAASYLVTTTAEREDLVAEAFTRVLQVLRSGRGPIHDFRPYLLVTMRHAAINAARRGPATALFADLPDAYLGGVADDPVDARLTGNDYAFLNIALNIASSFPYVASVTYAAPVSNAFARLPGTTASGLNPLTLTRTIVAENFRSPSADQFGLEVQRQMTDNLMLSVAYVGSASRNLEMAQLSNNAPTPGPGTPDQVNARRPYPYFGTLFFDTSRGKSSYNALQVRAERRFSQGFQFLIGYTFSKSLDNGTSGWFGAENGVGASSASLQDPAHPEASRSVSSYDVTHYLTASGIYELPFGRGKRWLQSGPAAWVLGGWQTNTILTARSGQPYNLAVIGDVANLGNNISWWNYARPNLVGNPRVANPTVQQAFNPGAFSVPSLSFGNFGRNVLRTNHVANVDFSIFKSFPLWNETSILEIRAEAFNLFNIMNYGAPDALIGSPTVGRISSVVLLPRQLQFAAKIVF